MRLKFGTPLSSQETASPSMIQERERRRSNASTISGKAVEPHMVGHLARHEAKAVLLDLMWPDRARGRPVGFRGQAWGMKPGGKALQHAHVTGQQSLSESRRKPQPAMGTPVGAAHERRAGLAVQPAGIAAQEA